MIGRRIGGLKISMEDNIIQTISSPEEPRRARWTWGEKLLAAFLALVFLFVFYITLDANKYSAQVRVIEGEGRVGINPTTESLDFGDLSPGTSAIRRIEIKNDTKIPMYVMTAHFGSINDLMKLSKSFFILPANSGDKIEFTVYMPASAPKDETLTGRVFIFKIPVPWK